MRRSSRNQRRCLRLSSCCTRQDTDEPRPATPRPGQTTWLTPRTEIGLRGQLRGPVARLPPGMHVGDGGARSWSRPLTQREVSDVTLVPNSQNSEIELEYTQRPAEQNSSTQEIQQESSTRRPETHRAQDDTREHRRRSLYIQNSPPLHDTRQQRRRSLATDNIPAQESRLESAGTGPEYRSAQHETRQQRRRSSRVDSLRRLESPVATGPGDRSTSRETRQRSRRSSQVDSSPRRQDSRRLDSRRPDSRRPDSRRPRRQSYLQDPPQLLEPGEDNDPGRMAHPPLCVENLFPVSPSPPNKPSADNGGASNAENGSGDVERAESSKDGARGNGEGGPASHS